MKTICRRRGEREREGSRELERLKTNSKQKYKKVIEKIVEINEIG